jgi:acylphosphatase
VKDRIAKKYNVRGLVQGVGFRAFVQYSAEPMGVKGWVRNLDDGSVEVYAIGTLEQLSELEGYLWRGPRWSEVRGVTVKEDVIDAGVRNFRIR